jgi:hypothetical protein
VIVATAPPQRSAAVLLRSACGWIAVGKPLQLRRECEPERGRRECQPAEAAAQEQAGGRRSGHRAVHGRTEAFRD